MTCNLGVAIAGGSPRDADFTPAVAGQALYAAPALQLALPGAFFASPPPDEAERGSVLLLAENTLRAGEERRLI